MKRQGELFFIPAELELEGYPHHFIPENYDGEWYYDYIKISIAVYENPSLNMEEGKAKGRKVAELMGRHTPEFFEVVDSDVFVRGTVTHPEHFTLELKEWHRVVKSAYSGIHPEIGYIRTD